MIFWLGLIGGRMASFVSSLHISGDEFNNVGFSLLGGLHVYNYEYEFSEFLLFYRYEFLIVVTRNFFIYKNLNFPL